LTSSICILTSNETFFAGLVLTGYCTSSSLSSSDSDLGTYFAYLTGATYFAPFTGALTWTSLIIIL